MALVFIGLPFVVRTVQPVIEEIEREVEEASATLGAGRVRTFVKVILPMLTPALLTGFALALARGVGEYGSVIFIAGNLPMVSEIAPLLIVIRLEEFDYDGAVAIALAMLAISFADAARHQPDPGLEPKEVSDMLDDTRTGLNGAVRQLFARIAPSAVARADPPGRRSGTTGRGEAGPRDRAAPPPTATRRADAHAAFRTRRGLRARRRSTRRSRCSRPRSPGCAAPCSPTARR